MANISIPQAYYIWNKERKCNVSLTAWKRHVFKYYPHLLYKLKSIKKNFLDSETLDEIQYNQVYLIDGKLVNIDY